MMMRKSMFFMTVVALTSVGNVRCDGMFSRPEKQSMPSFKQLLSDEQSAFWASMEGILSCFKGWAIGGAGLFIIAYVCDNSGGKLPELAIGVGGTIGGLGGLMNSVTQYNKEYEKREQEALKKVRDKAESMLKDYGNYTEEAGRVHQHKTGYSEKLHRASAELLQDQDNKFPILTEDAMDRRRGLLYDVVRKTERADDVAVKYKEEERMKMKAVVA